MGPIRNILSIFIALSFVVACSSGEEAVVVGSDGPGKVENSPVKGGTENSNQEEPKEFFEQNREYSKVFIQNAIDEKPDSNILAVLQSDKNSADRKLVRKQEALDFKTLEVQDLERQKKMLENKNANKASEKRRLLNEKQLNSNEISSLDRDIRAINSQISQLDSQINRKRREIQQVEDEIYNLENHRSRLKNEVAYLRSDNQALRRQNQNHKMKRDQAKQKISRLKQKKQQAKTAEEKAQIQQKIIRQRDRVQRLTSQIQQNKQRIQNNESLITQKQNRIFNVTQRINNHDANLRRLDRELRRLEDSRRPYVVDRQSKQRSKNRLVSRNHRIDQEIYNLSTLSDKLVEVKARLRQARKEQAQLTLERDEAQASFDVVAKNHAQFSANMKTKRDRLRTLEELNDLSLEELYQSL